MLFWWGVIGGHRAANHLKSSSVDQRARGSSPAVQTSNMAGRGGDVMSSRSGSRSATNPQPQLQPPPRCPSPQAGASEEQKPRKRRRAFCLSRMKTSCSSSAKPAQHQPASNNNNTAFMLHCHIGKEIRHICSNCRGAGAESLDGERTREKAPLNAPLSPEKGGGGGFNLQ